MPPLSPPPHVMLFDSSRVTRGLVDDLLTENRYQVTVSSFLPQTFAQIAGLQPSLLIIDLGFHEHVGWDLLERLAIDTLTNRIPVIVTATEPRLLAQAERLQARFGGESWIIKPFDVEVLLNEIHRLIAT